MINVKQIGDSIITRVKGINRFRSNYMKQNNSLLKIIRVKYWTMLVNKSPKNSYTNGRLIDCVLKTLGTSKIYSPMPSTILGSSGPTNEMREYTNTKSKFFLNLSRAFLLFFCLLTNAFVKYDYETSDKRD